jgi:hypothetical protein
MEKFESFIKESGIKFICQVFVELTVAAATMPAAAMSRTPAGSSARAKSMNITSPAPTATATKKKHIGSAHINASTIHITNTSRKCRQRRASQNKGGRADNSFGLQKMLDFLHGKNLNRT